MLINGCLTNNNAGIDEDHLNEIFVELGYEDGIINEELAVVGGDYQVIEVDGDDGDFNITTKDKEHRIIREDEIEDIFEREAGDVYDEYQWREEVANEATTEGYDSWFDDIINNADYGSFFASYDGDEEMCGDYYVFRVN